MRIALTVNGERLEADVWAGESLLTDAPRPASIFPARRTPASRVSADRAPSCSTGRSSARASFSPRRPTATRSSRSRGSPTETGSIPCRRRLPKPARFSAASARRGSSSRPRICSAVPPTRRRTRSARRSPGTSAAAPGTRRSSTPCAWRPARERADAHPAAGPRLATATRRDAVPKVKGEFAYSSDLHQAGMLWGHTVRSPHVHARILGIDVADALAMPGVHAVLTHEDVPGEKPYGLDFADQPVLAIDRVRYFGEPVAVVAAEEPEQARRAAAAVRVDYEILEPVVDAERATEMEPLHPDRPTMGIEHGYRDDPRPNVVRSMVIRRGDPETPGDVVGRGRLRRRSAGSGIPRARVRNRDPGRRGRRRHPRRDAVAPRRPRSGRAVSRARAGAGPDPPRRSRRSVRWPRRPLDADPRRDARAADESAGEDRLRPRGVVRRARPPAPGTDLGGASGDARRSSSSPCGCGSSSTAAPMPPARQP